MSCRFISLLNPPNSTHFSLPSLTNQPPLWLQSWDALKSTNNTLIRSVSAITFLIVFSVKFHHYNNTSNPLHITCIFSPIPGTHYSLKMNYSSSPINFTHFLFEKTPEMSSPDALMLNNTSPYFNQQNTLLMPRFTHVLPISEGPLKTLEENKHSVAKRSNSGYIIKDIHLAQWWVRERHN